MARKRVLVLVLLLLQCGEAAAKTVLVAAASSMRPVLEQIQQAYRAAGGQAFTVSYGASGNLTHQILRGAPYDLFLTADIRHSDELKRSGLDVQSDNFADGRLALFAKNGSACESIVANSSGLTALTDSRIRTIAIANTELAPYGRAAAESLRSAGIWEHVQNRLAYANNVSQAAQFALSGAADCALVAQSLVVSELHRHGDASLVDSDRHQPVQHAVVLLSVDEPSASDLYAYLVSEAVKEILVQNGFEAVE